MSAPKSLSSTLRKVSFLSVSSGCDEKEQEPACLSIAAKQRPKPTATGETWQSCRLGKGRVLSRLLMITVVAREQTDTAELVCTVRGRRSVHAFREKRDRGGSKPLRLTKTERTSLDEIAPLCLSQGGRMYFTNYFFGLDFWVVVGRPEFHTGQQKSSFLTPCFSFSLPLYDPENEVKVKVTDKGHLTPKNIPEFIRFCQNSC